MNKHIIKYEYDNGVKLKHPTLWCGSQPEPRSWLFQDVQHALLSIEQGSTIAPCRNCLKAANMLMGVYLNE